MAAISGAIGYSIGVTNTYSHCEISKDNTSDDSPDVGLFSRILNKQENTSGKDNFTIEQEKLQQYLAERDKAFKEKYGDSLPKTMVAVAMPYTPGLGTPFITAEQQQLIDRITDKYIGRKDISGFMDELTANGVDPNQITAGADYFIDTGGRVLYKNGDLVSSNLLEIVA